MKILQTSELKEIYAQEDDLAFQRIEARYRDLEEAFAKEYQGLPVDVFIRAPGRVNIIGEHIDYEGYSVLPMAISKEVIFAVSLSNTETTTNGSIELANMNAAKFPPASVSTDPTAPINLREHHWTNYFRCGYKGVWMESPGGPLELTRQKRMNASRLKILVDGNVPTGSGLSSSSAFVVASALVTQWAKEERNVLSKSAEEMGELCRKAEQYIGTMSGGMDQAISCCGVAGQAQVVHFFPLRTEPVALPPRLVFVIAHSLTVAEKAKTATTHYNKRVVECMLAAKLLAKSLSLESWMDMTTLKQVQEEFCDKNKNTNVMADSDLGSLDQMLHHVAVHFPTPDRIYSSAELKQIFGINALTDLFHDNDVTAAISQVLVDTDAFQLGNRARHVYSEAARVLAFQALAKDSQTTGKAFGQLMNASHKSCARDYDCSSSELDDLVKCCREHGAFGSRLTGAGWGGCTVSLVAEQDCAEFVANIKQDFYHVRMESKSLASANLDEYIFACRPSNGASIYIPSLSND